MKILITGATGFIGRNLVWELISRGERPVCLVRDAGRSGFLREMGAELFFGDITDEESLSRLPPFDVVVHCAALVEEPALAVLRRVNVGGTGNICRFAMRCGARLVYVSSVAVVSGNPPGLLRDDAPCAAVNNYGISKLEAERCVLGFREKGLSCAVIRPPMVYGEGEPHALNLLCSCLRRRMLPLVNGGRSVLHMAYVRNVVAALLLAAKSPEFLSGTFFCADREALTVAEILTTLSRAIGAPRPFELPGPVSSALLALPWIGPRLGVFAKDRRYDTWPLACAGYRDVVPAREALILTGKWWKVRHGG